MAFVSRQDRWKLTCPADSGVMEAVRLGVGTPLEVTLDRCSTCGGIWLDAGELDKLTQHDPDLRLEAVKIDSGSAHRPRTRTNSAAPRQCPRDGTLLVTTEHKQQFHVMIDRCTSCHGIFLDAGELKDLSEFTLKERLRAMLHG
jgi:Zn-finger nucleic acid-binding protein